MGTGSFPGIKRPWRGVDHPPPHNAEVKEGVQLYLFPFLAFVVCSWMSFTFTFTDIALVNTQNVPVTKIVDSSSIQCAETKYGLRIQLLALVFMTHEVWLNA